ncbi:MAG TPA: hypothetical protein VNK96_09340 [Fimbriimonadales bacterium]|nr:hypothetical protein [Fimbriimonadales bacterium]
MNKITLFLVSLGLMSGALAGCGGAANAVNPDKEKQLSSNLDQTAHPSEEQVSDTSKSDISKKADFPAEFTDKPKSEEPKGLKSGKVENASKVPAISSKTLKQEPRSGGGVGRQEGQDRPRFGQGGMGRRGGYFGLLRRDDVRKELKLTQEQIAKIEALSEQFRGQPGQRDPQGARDPNAMRERLQKMEAAIKEILNAEQFKRLQELRLQLEGPSAIARPEVQEKLGLSEAQKKQIEEILNKSQEEMRALFQQGGGAGGRQEAMEAIRKIREETDKKILAVLTEEQRKKWETMLGKPFKFENPPPRNRKK